jgi:hypothetical protein
MDAQLDHEPRPRRPHDPLRERHMTPPRAERAAPRREPKQRIEVGMAKLAQ